MGIVNRISSLFQGLNWLIIPAAFLAIVFHEVSHGYAAYLMGDNTAKNSGRLSLNPIKHMDFLGLICMVLFGFGWAKPVPVNPYYFKNRKLGMSLVALAGPLSNLIMAVLSLVFSMLLMRLDITSYVVFYIQQIIMEFLILLSVLNVGLAVFNLIPIPPLDGSKILFALLPQRAYGFVLKYERYGMLILFVLINIPLFSDFLTNIREGIFNGMISALSVILF